jgi:hypothetical protein
MLIIDNNFFDISIIAEKRCEKKKEKVLLMRESS